jgi:secretion/DNA translocation related TadE-like protein
MVLALAAVVLLVGLGLTTLGAAQQARAAAQSAADLGAISGAAALQHGFDPCGTAREAVARNAGVVTWCRVEDGGIVGLAVARATGDLPGLLGRVAAASARAGPRIPGG